MPHIDEDCTPESHDLNMPHIIIDTVELPGGQVALRLCHQGYDTEDALTILKHITTMFHQDLVAMYAKRN